MVVAFYFRLHLAYFSRPAVSISARPEHSKEMLFFSRSFDCNFSKNQYPLRLFFVRGKFKIIRL